MKTPSEEFKNTHKLRFTLLTSLPLQRHLAEEVCQQQDQVQASKKK